MNIPFFSGKKKNGKKSAKELLASACNVYNYRRDVMGEENSQKLQALINKTEELFDDGKTETPEYKKTTEELEAFIRKHGGTIYPLGFWADNVDVVIVAGILALTIRSFFIQTFQIPTNSMYPTYFGMTPKVYVEGEDSPSGIAKIGRKIFKGASNYNLSAPENGEVFVEISRPERNLEIFKYEKRPTRWLGILPSTGRFHFFSINGKAMELSIPADFSIDEAMKKAHPFGTTSEDSLVAYYNALLSAGKIVEKNGRLMLSLGKFNKGQSILNFDILAGDMLIVDRFTYNFRRPKIGEPIVFRTGEIAGMKEYSSDDLYYIKRLVGQSGDTLKIDGTTLIRNGKPIEGAAAFKANAERLGEYPGYRQEKSMKDGKTITVPSGHFFGLGDNSASSLDSRYWGPLPESAVVGKPLIIFYPFTNRWGAAK